MATCDEVKVTEKGYYDLTKLTKEHYYQFRHVFIEERMHNALWKQNDSDNHKVMDTILNALCLIVTKRVPQDANIPKIDQLHHKVRLLPPATAQQQELKPAQSLVRLSNSSQSVLTPMPGKSKELDGADNPRAYLVNGRTAALPYSVLVINQHAGKVIREDLIH